MSILAFDKRSSNICNDSSTLMSYGISVLNRSAMPESAKYSGDRTFDVMSVMDRKGSEREKGVGDDCSSSSSSSIGENSDDELVAVGGGCCKEEEDEVESPLRRKRRREKSDQSYDNLDALHESLPFRKGISRFYNGKSKSFASLGDATAVASIKEVVKPENAYSRRKRNLLAYTLLYENNNNQSHRRGGGKFARGASLQSCQGRGVSKRPAISSTRSTFALAVTNVTSPSSKTGSGIDLRSIDPQIIDWGKLNPCSPGSNDGRCTNNVSLSRPSPLVHRNMHPWRSFSVMDLQHCGATTGGGGGGGGGAAAALNCGCCLSPSSAFNDHKKSDQVS